MTFSNDKPKGPERRIASLPLLFLTPQVETAKGQGRSAGKFLVSDQTRTHQITNPNHIRYQVKSNQDQMAPQFSAKSNQIKS